MTRLSIGFSPCPNDTYMFYPFMHGLLPSLEGILFDETIDDVETLNKLALRGTLDITKVSYAVLGHITDQYVLLKAGSALGHGCGPLLVTSPSAPAALLDYPIAIPGEHTTAALLLQLYTNGCAKTITMPFHMIPGAVARGEVAGGVIIHESRFTYHQLGLISVQDLGIWWEETTQLPLPLGGIVAKRSLGKELLQRLEQSLTQSVIYSKNHPEDAQDYITHHAQEMDPTVCKAHISLYVNAFSESLGSTGEQAVTELLSRGREAGLIPSQRNPLFISG